MNIFLLYLNFQYNINIGQIMSKLLYLSEKQLVKNSSNVEIANSLKESILFFLNNHDTSGFVFDLKTDIEDNKKILLLINKFNPLLPVIILSENDIPDLLKKWNSNIIGAKNFDEVIANRNIYINKRKFYRINWPLNIAYSYSYDMPNSSTGKILTLSLGGAYIITDDIHNLETNQKLICRVEFSIFFLLVESSIIRIIDNHTSEIPMGFAVQFENITDATKKCINRIINDEVISVLSKEFTI
jgi:hypothetical protein